MNRRQVITTAGHDRGGQIATQAARVNEGSTRAILAAFLANLGIAIAKFVAFVFTGAASMLAESIHSVADTGNQALFTLGSLFALFEGYEKLRHPHGIESPAWAFGACWWRSRWRAGRCGPLSMRPKRYGPGCRGGRSSAVPRARTPSCPA